MTFVYSSCSMFDNNENLECVWFLNVETYQVAGVNLGPSFKEAIHSILRASVDNKFFLW